MFSSHNNLMQVENVDLEDKTDAVLEDAKNILFSNGGELIGEEEIKMRICYKLKETDSKNLTIHFFKQNLTRILVLRLNYIYLIEIIIMSLMFYAGIKEARKILMW